MTAIAESEGAMATNSRASPPKLAIVYRGRTIVHSGSNIFDSRESLTHAISEPRSQISRVARRNCEIPQIAPMRSEVRI